MPYKIRGLYFFILLAHGFFGLPAALGQITFDLSSGIQVAKAIDTSPTISRLNRYRRGTWVSVGGAFLISKGLSLRTNITYQQRQPQEQFIFPIDTMQTATLYEAFSGYPSNPQNSVFRENDYTNFPDFKYLGIEIGPTYRLFLGDQFDIEIGCLVFGNFLLNKRQTTVFPNDLLWIRRNFFPNLNLNQIRGDNSYRRFDAGFLPFLQLRSFQGEQLSLGLQIKSYFSHTPLHESDIFGRNAFDSRWVSFAAGVSASWRLIRK